MTFFQGGLTWLTTHVDADMDAGAHAIGGAELRHPHEHVDAELLRPGQVDREQDRKQERHAEQITVHHSDEDDRGRERHQRRDQDFLKPVEDAQQYQCAPLQSSRQPSIGSALAGIQSSCAVARMPGQARHDEDFAPQPGSSEIPVSVRRATRLLQKFVDQRLADAAGDVLVDCPPSPCASRSPAPASA